MNKRITCISMFNEESINKIENLVRSVDIKLCKVPCFEENREENDTLPYHITLQSWSEVEKENAINISNKIKINKIKLYVNKLEIKNSKNDTYNLYLGIEENNELMDIYNQFYKITNNLKYNPKSFIPHITLHCDKNYNNIINIKNILEKNFEPFVVEFEEMGIFKIYPAEKVNEEEQ